MDVKITIKNMDQIKRAFRHSPQITTKHLDRAIKKAILLIGRKSRQFTPVDTGRLRASHLEVFRPLHGETGTHVNYDIFVHEGTRYMPARPFMTQAVEQSDFEIQAVFKYEVQNALDEIARLA